MGRTNEKHVHEVFQSISTKYDKMNGVISLNMHKQWRRDIMRQMSLPVHAQVLDVCCGTGDWTIAIANQLEGKGKVHGLDFSENMLEVGQKKVDDEKLTNVELLHGDATELPFADESFHVVTIGFGLRNVPDPKKALQEILRVLKPGGQVLCLETSHPENVLFKRFILCILNKSCQAGRWVAGSGKEYQWLYDSTATFPKKKELAEWFVDSGFVDVNFRSYAGGAAAGHWGFKRSVLEDAIYE
ncbi:LOW QUALITY PROTEIN: 2-heptaprenyl-1,4-naphthoquinone methyltransferase [Geomicrobium sp. JCM 19037]|nr:LOW QUALITY PROTEIN: 2-heptaprenyl-1,4-naphthoquinone methyltransferase [Geomicrobium sp. JCM 19037]